MNPKHLLLLLVLAAPVVGADEFAWSLKKDEGGISISTRAVDGSDYKAVRATMIVESSLGKLVALVRDTSACPEWAAMCRESHVEEAVSETLLYVYSYNDVPWPAKDRDAVARVNWSQDPETLAVLMEASAVPGRMPETDSAIRLTSAVTRWIFTPLGDGRVEVATEAHVDPGGPMPAWLFNILLVNSPFETLANMREIVSSERYAGASFDFLVEP